MVVFEINDRFYVFLTFGHIYVALLISLIMIFKTTREAMNTSVAYL